MKNKSFKLLFLSLFFFAIFSGSALAQGAPEASQTTGIHYPLFLGGAVELGACTGVGTERGLGIRELEPMLGIWYPSVGFFRVGYGFYDYDESPEKGDSYKVEHSDLDIELGIHLLGEIYVTGVFSKVKELSDLGDVAFHEWGLGVGSLLNIFSKTMLFAEIGYRFVLEHYDPFLEKDVSGSRWQFNLGFAAYVY